MSRPVKPPPDPSNPLPGVPWSPLAPGPEPPPDSDERPGWTAWQVVAAFASALAGTITLGAVVIGAGAAILDASAEDPPPGLTIVGVLVQDAMLLGCAIGFAALTRRPRSRDFGFRASPFWQSVGWAALGLLGFMVLNAIYTGIFQPNGEQSVADDLGVKDSTAALVAGGFVVIVLAPVIEEFFFRGFFYRGLRNSLVPLAGPTTGILLAAAIDGALFGVIHFTGAKTVPVLPVLAMLGFVFCLVYEKTGSLYTVIGLHALVNTVAYANITDDSAPVALGFGGAVLALCVLLPRFAPELRPRRPAAAGP